jgi:hypothetical protein
VYGGPGLVALGGGVTIGGFAVLTTGTTGAGVVAMLVAVVAVLLSYRAARVRRASRSE